MTLKQKYKVFIYDQPVNFITPDEASSLGCKDSIDPAAIPELLSNTNALAPFCVVATDPAKAWNSFLQKNKIVRAAGGVVMQEGPVKKLLMIHRLGKWDLPKGKLDAGESPDVAAIREVEEECGIHGMTILKKMEDTWHMYREKKQWLLKQTTWYEMVYFGKELLIPQTDENIAAAEWVPLDELPWKLQQSYASIQDLLKDHFK